VSDNNFSKEFYERWEHLLSNIDMEEVPLNFVKEIIMKFDNNKENVSFNIKKMRQDRVPVKEIEKSLKTFLNCNDEDVIRVDFQLDVEEVASIVSKKVTKILGK
jgi:hypothetical protein